MRRFPLVAALVVVAGVVAAVWFLEPEWSPFVRSPAQPESDNQLTASSGDENANGSAAMSSERAAESASEPGADVAGAPAAGDDTTTTMTLVGGDISLSYPEGFGLAVNQEQLLVSSYIPVCDQGFEYCIYLASDEFAGTNLDGAGLRIDVRDDIGSEADCMLQQPAGYSDLQPHIAGSGDHTTAIFGEVGQGAAGHFTNGAVYRLYYDRTCYELETRIAQTQFGNYEEGAVERFTNANEADLEERFGEILASVSLPDDREGLWSEDRFAEAVPAEEQVRNLTPEAQATISSPLELSGEAVGPWFFEGSFPYRLQTHDGDVLASGAVTAEGDWTTTDFVRFSASIEFEVEARVAGTLVLMKDNPSGLAENDAAVEVPVTLQP